MPLDKVTEPVGVGLLPPPLTTTVTERDCAVVMLERAGVTVTVGVILVDAAVKLLRKAGTSREPRPVASS